MVSGGYGGPAGVFDLFLKQGASAIQVERGDYVGFNRWSGGTPFGTLSSTATTLAVVDASGASIEPLFPAPDGGAR